jgi:large subunit ribosomal protein L31
MKAQIHPTWYPEASVVCACGNTWTTGATVPSIRTEICSACHPFYTGEQRIVDTEGQVDRFMKRLQVRDNKRAEVEQREAAKLPGHLQITELGLETRYAQILVSNGVVTTGDVLTRLEEQGDEGILNISGIGRKVLADLKRALRARGFELPRSVETEAAE